ncbi:MAG: hypothetical protein NTZ55_00930, partial [Candidatus Roizmanbacteria bacterium]|nr:hypothetical protein [Candidatus Roizmanbacteria bacterium]
MPSTFEQVKHSAAPSSSEIPINSIQLYTGKIQSFMENPGSRQLICRDITTTFLEHPETIIDYTEAFQTAKTTSSSKSKAKDFETLDRFVIDEIKLYPRTHFQEVVDNPQRLLPVIRTTLNVENPNSNISINDYPKLDQKRK